MKVAVFSDVHGNLSALQAVLNSIQQQPDLDEIIFAGDLCVFGPRPQACIQLIREHHIATLAGNTDDWIFRPPPLSNNLSSEQRKHREIVRSICRWTREQFSKESLDWLEQLCRSFQMRYSPTGNKSDDLLVVHANPVDLNQLIFPPENDQITLYGRIRQNDADLTSLLAEVEAGLIAFGHLHIPSIRQWKDISLVNVSSISMPGDGDGRAKYALISWSGETGWSVEHVRVQYEVATEIEAFRQFRPPGWRSRVDDLISKGFIPQIV